MENLKIKASEIVDNAHKSLFETFNEIDEITEYNQKKVLDAFYNNKIGEEHFKDYFIMFDEIDSYQYDSYYRPKMEESFDYYFKFPKKQRCLVSATIGNFSNPLIKEEPIINIKSPKPILTK